MSSPEKIHRQSMKPIALNDGLTPQDLAKYAFVKTINASPLQVGDTIEYFHKVRLNIHVSLSTCGH